MVAKLLDGRHVANQIKVTLKKNVVDFIKEYSRTPTLAVILLGDDASSQIYVVNKHKACDEVGIVAQSYYLSVFTAEDELLKLIAELNAATNIDGILVQLPLPSHINMINIINAIDVNKDVDGFHPYNTGCLAMRTSNYAQADFLKPCTPMGIMQLLDFYKIVIKGKNAVVIGASNIVGRPMALEFLKAGATITICHRFTTDLEQHVKMAEILVVATGIPDLIHPSWLHEKHIIVDVGMRRDSNGKLRGEINYEQAISKVAWITPVPGGVGPMTIVTLLQNTILASKIIANSQHS